MYRQAYGADDKAGVLSWSVAATAVMSVISIFVGVALWYSDAVAVTLFRQPEHIAQVSCEPVWGSDRSRLRGTQIFILSSCACSLYIAVVTRYNHFSSLMECKPFRRLVV